MRITPGNRPHGRGRRAMRTRCKQRELGVHRLVVYRSNSHIYAQIITPDARVVAASSTMDKSLAKDIKSGGNAAAAARVGSLIAERSKEKGIEKVAFDRGGYRYHGRIKALAEAAREGGLKF